MKSLIHFDLIFVYEESDQFCRFFTFSCIEKRFCFLFFVFVFFILRIVLLQICCPLSLYLLEYDLGIGLDFGKNGIVGRHICLAKQSL